MFNFNHNREAPVIDPIIDMAQQKEKENIETAEKKGDKQTIHSNRKSCLRCKRETYPRYLCACSGGGGSSDDSDETAGNDDAKTPAHIPDKINGLDQELHPITPTPANKDQESELDLNDDKFDPEVISDLLHKKILIIESTIDADTEMGILAIKLQYPLDLLTTVQRNEFKKFINAHINALNDFKAENNILAECVQINRDNKNNIIGLRIAMPLDLYGQYIKSLASKLLLPLYVINQEEKPVYEPGVNYFKPNNLSPSLTPAVTKLAVDEVDQTAKAAEISQDQPKVFNPIPQLIPRPWGWKE